MTEFQNKSFSVYPGAVGTQQYRDNYDRIFGKKKDEPQEEPVPDTEKEEWPCRLHRGQQTPGEWCSHRACKPDFTHDSKDCLTPRGCQGCR